MRRWLVSAMLVIFAVNPGHAKEPPVISVAYLTSARRFFSAVTEKQITPGIDIYSDGLVSIRRFDGTEQTKYIKAEHVQPLVDSLEKTKFYEISEDSFRAAVNKSRADGASERISITDLATTKISVRTGRTMHTTEFNGINEYAKEYPKIQQLKILRRAISMVYKAAEEKEQ